MRAWRAFFVVGWVVLVGGVGLAGYLYMSRFRFGDGLTAEFKPTPEKMVSVLRDFTTLFAVLLAFQSAAFFGVLSLTAKQPSARVLYLGLASLLVFFMGLFWTLTDIAVGMIGGVSLPSWHVSFLMTLLTVGTALTLFLVGEVVRNSSACR